jgi:prolyl 4-hydroxylase
MTACVLLYDLEERNDLDSYMVFYPNTIKNSSRQIKVGKVCYAIGEHTLYAIATLTEKLILRNNDTLNPNNTIVFSELEVTDSMICMKLGNHIRKLSRFPDLNRPLYAKQVPIVYLSVSLNFTQELPKLVNRQPIADQSTTGFIADSLLNQTECKTIINECLKNPLSNVSNEYEKTYRNNRRLLFYDHALASLLWKRIHPVIYDRDLENVRPSGFGVSGYWTPIGFNSLFRFSVYGQDELFKKHQDAGYCENNSCRSVWSVVIYLNDDFKGGETTFYSYDGEITTVVKPEQGRAVVFEHDQFHQGNVVLSGTKYVLRGDIMFLRYGPETIENKLTVQHDIRFARVRFLYHECILASQKNEPTRATTFFNEALQVIQSLKLKPTKNENSKLVQTCGDTSTMIQILMFLSPLIISCVIRRLNRWFFARSQNNTLWKQLYAKEWPKSFDIERSLLNQEQRLQPYAALYKSHLQLCKGVTKSRMAIFFEDDNVYVSFKRCKDTTFSKILCMMPSAAQQPPEDLDGYWGYRFESRHMLFNHELPYGENIVCFTFMDDKFFQKTMHDLVTYAYERLVGDQFTSDSVMEWGGMGWSGMGRDASDSADIHFEIVWSSHFTYILPDPKFEGSSKFVDLDSCLFLKLEEVYLASQQKALLPKGALPDTFHPDSIYKPSWCSPQKANEIMTVLHHAIL